MPTGYTQKLYEGEQSFEAFVLGCARAFGATILMRDSDPDEPISIEAITDNSDYHIKGLENAKAELERLRGLTPQQVIAETHRSNEAASVSHDRYVASRAEMRSRYEDMLEKVRAWEPPSKEHEEFKAYMVEQLTGSIDFDTSMTHITAPKLLTSDEWYSKQLADRQRDIEYHTEKEAQRIERNEGRIQWVSALWESLGMEVAA